MKAVLLVRRRISISDISFIEIVIWKVPTPVPGSSHDFKYRLAFVVDGECLLRYDNEAGKGDHRHIRGEELPYRFTAIERLLPDFLEEVEKQRR
jgi:hypothetical protein